MGSFGAGFLSPKILMYLQSIREARSIYSKPSFKASSSSSVPPKKHEEARQDMESFAFLVFQLCLLQRRQKMDVCVKDSVHFQDRVAQCH